MTFTWQYGLEPAYFKKNKQAKQSKNVVVCEGVGQVGNKMPKSFQQLVVPVLLIVAIFSIQAEMYQWRDDQGRIHYSDKPPVDAEQKADKVDIRVKNNDFNYMDEDRMESVRREEVNKQVQEDIQLEEQIKNAKTEERKQLKCKRLKNNLKSLEGPVVLVDKDGNQIPMTEKERAEKVEEWRKLYQKHCS